MGIIEDGQPVRLPAEHFIEAENPDYSRHYWGLDIVAEIEAYGSFNEIQRRMAFGGLALPIVTNDCVVASRRMPAV